MYQYTDPPYTSIIQTAAFLHQKTSFIQTVSSPRTINCINTLNLENLLAVPLQFKNLKQLNF